MTRPMIATKLFAPQLRAGLVARPRLLDRMRLGARMPLTLVSAPPGFGKTTLLAAWLGAITAEGHSVAWLSLDTDDREPAVFWAGVVAALHPAMPTATSALEQPASSASTEQLLTALLNELATAPGELWLVLDDYHLADGREVTAGLGFLLEHLPPQVHVVLSTRADPDLPLSRWRARAELTEIRAADLRFTPEEAAEYLNTVAGLDLAPAQVATLEQRTEGWVAALQLAALSLRGRADVGDFIARFAGDDRYIVDYLIDEVLAHQSDATREFLLQSAVLDRLTGPLCDAVTGRHDGSELLVTLERANLFVVPLDDRRQWYRYHHLFAEVLRVRLLAEQADLVPLLHGRAARWYESQGLAEQAIGHALAGGDVDHAAYLVESVVPAVRRDRREALLVGWMSALPDDVVRRSPVLSMVRGSVHLAAGELDAVEARLDDAERTLTGAPDGTPPDGAEPGAHRPWAQTEELRTLPATIAVYRAALAQARGDVAGTEHHARRALELAGPGDHLSHGAAAGFLAMAGWARGEVPAALQTFAQAVDSLTAAGNLVDALSGTVVLGDLWLAAGRPTTARGLYRRALDTALAHGETVARATSDLYVGLSELDHEAGDLPGAQRHLDRAAALGERALSAESGHRWFVAAARLAGARGEPAEALALLDQAERRYRPGFYPQVRPIAALRARVWIAQGRLPEAADWARERGVPMDGDAGYLREFDQLTLVRLILARHRRRPDVAAVGQALDLLGALAGAAEGSGRAGSLFELRLLQALANEALGLRARALDRLGLALTEVPEPAGYARLLLDEGRPVVGLLPELTGGAAREARQLLLLAAPAPAPAADPAPAPTESLSQSLSERELQVLRLLDSDLTGPQIARELFISHNTLRTHTKHIFTKLGVTSRRAAVRDARARGLL